VPVFFGRDQEGSRVGQLLKRLSIGLLIAAAIVLIFVLTDRLESLVESAIDRFGAVRTLWVVGLATVVLGLAWVRYGGARVLRLWGVVLKPIRPEEGAAGTDAGSDPERRPRLVGPRK
jgi:hypothetical protein